MTQLIKHTYAVGDEVSYGFNGDWYHAGQVAKVSAKFLTTTRGNKFGLKIVNDTLWTHETGTVLVKREVFRSIHGGTWTLTKGIIERQNPHF